MKANNYEKNASTLCMARIAEKFEKPKAILAASVHRVTQGTRVNDAMKPKQTYDMYGFPKELYRLNYTSKGHPDLKYTTLELTDHMYMSIIVGESTMEHGQSFQDVSNGGCSGFSAQFRPRRE